MSTFTSIMLALNGESALALAFIFATLFFTVRGIVIVVKRMLEAEDAKP